MKHFIITFVITFTSFFTFAQENKEVTENSTNNPKVKELGIIFSNFDNYGLTFRIGNQKRLLRINTLSFKNYQESNSSDYTNKVIQNTSIGTSIGIEFRKNVTNEFQLRAGVDGIYRYTKTISQNKQSETDYYNEQRINTYGLGLVLGANYVYREKLVLGVEIVPSYTIKRGQEKNQQALADIAAQKIKGSSFDLSNESVKLSIAYRF